MQAKWQTPAAPLPLWTLTVKRSPTKEWMRAESDTSAAAYLTVMTGQKRWLDHEMYDCDSVFPLIYGFDRVLCFQRGAAMDSADLGGINDDEMLAAVLEMSRQEAGLSAPPSVEDEPTSSPDTGFGDTDAHDLSYHADLLETDSKQPAGNINLWDSDNECMMKNALTCSVSVCFNASICCLKSFTWILSWLKQFFKHVLL